MSVTRRAKMVLKKVAEKNIDELKQRVKNTIKFFERGEYGKCRDLSLKLAETKEIQKDKELTIMLLKNAAAASFKLCDYDNACVYYKKALHAAEKDAEKFTEIIKKIKKEICYPEMLKLAVQEGAEKALEMCESFLEENPGDSGLLELKGNFLYGLQKYEEAILCYEDLMEKSVVKEMVYYKIGVCYFFLDDFETAYEYLKKSQKENPENPKIHLALGEVAFKRGEILEALANFEKGEKMAPKETGFLIYLIECFRLTGQFKKIYIKAEKIIKSENETAFELLMNWLCKIKEDEIKIAVMLKTLELLPKKQTLLKKFQEILAGDADELIEIIKGAEKLFLENLESGAHGTYAKNKKIAEFIRSIMNPVMEAAEQRKKQARELCKLFKPFFEFQEVYNAVCACQEKAKEALEFKLVQKVIEKCELPQEWQNFAGAMKLKQGDIILPLKALADFMDACSVFDNRTTVLFDDSGNGALAIEENINKITFKIFPDFPGILDSAKLMLLVKFYEKRLEYWENLPDFISEGKFAPPPLMTARDWIKKTGKKPLRDEIVLEELSREGNNLKLDLLMRKIEDALFKKTEPFLKILAIRSSSLPFKTRFEEKRISENDKLALLINEYYSYIRKNTKIRY